MIRLFSTNTNRKQFSLRKFLLTLFICAFVATWFGISATQADENDPDDSMENTGVNFQNAAQERHAKNIAIKAVLQNSDLMDEISDTKEKEGVEAARAQFKEAVADYMQEISEKRAQGEGWGNIAKDYDVHPRYLGLGHFKKHEKYAGQSYSSKNKDGGLALGHGKYNGSGHGVGHGGGNGHGNGGGNGAGRGGGKN